jgi:hypothetical protein
MVELRGESIIRFLLRYPRCRVVVVWLYAAFRRTMQCIFIGENDTNVGVYLLLSVAPLVAAFSFVLLVLELSRNLERTRVEMNRGQGLTAFQSTAPIEHPSSVSQINMTM